MISAEQKLQIEQYLISKKLPLDILLEVKDHMILQVEDVMNAENLNFDEGFSKVEISWKENFKLTTFWVFYGNDKIPVIAKKITKEKCYIFFKKSVMIAFLSFMITLLLIYLTPNEELFKLYFKIYNSLFIIAPILLLLSNFKMLKFLKSDFKYRNKVFYSLYQKNASFVIINLFAMSQVVFSEGKQYVYMFFKSNSTGNHVPFLISLVGYFLFHTMVVFGILNFIEHKKVLKKLQILN